MTSQKKNSKPYGPNERDYLAASEKPVKSYSLKDSVKLPNHVVDPIVVNNIAYPEFDYTYNEGADILDIKDKTNTPPQKPQ